MNNLSVSPDLVQFVAITNRTLQLSFQDYHSTFQFIVKFWYQEIGWRYNTFWPAIFLYFESTTIWTNSTIERPCFILVSGSIWTYISGTIGTYIFQRLLLRFIPGFFYCLDNWRRFVVCKNPRTTTHETQRTLCLIYSIDKLALVYVYVSVSHAMVRNWVTSSELGRF